MKKIVNKFVVIAMLLLAVVAIVPTNVLANTITKYAASRNEYQKTTEGIEVSFNEEESKIIYVIPEDFAGEEVYFNIVEDLMTTLEGSYVPGANAPFKIEVINNSDYEYHYLKDSLTIDTLTFDSEFNEEYPLYGEEVWYQYVNGQALGKYIKDAVAFDGSKIRASYSINRTSNAAIISLFKNSEEFVNDKYQGCSIKSNISNGSLACQKIMTDEVLGQELIAQGYEGGISDLNKYYLDYFNAIDGSSATKLEDLSQTSILKILSGNRFQNRETNSEVNELGYNWFYNECLFITPESDVDGNMITYNDLDSTYTIGAYMRGENDIFEKVFQNDLGNIESGDLKSLRSFEMYLSGPKTTNVFMDMNFGFMMSFKLEREVIYGEVVSGYVDTEGNILADSEISSGIVGEEYQTEAKDIEGYKLITVEGNETGKYIDGTIYVTYYYDKNVGTGDVEIMSPQTGYETSTISKVMIPNIIVYKKKEEKLI